MQEELPPRVDPFNVTGYVAEIPWRPTKSRWSSKNHFPKDATDKFGTKFVGLCSATAVLDMTLGGLDRARHQERCAKCHNILRSRKGNR